MMNKSVQTSFNGPESGSLDTSLDEWAKLEQVYTPNSAQGATIKDAINMVRYAESGISAFQYVNDSCAYIVGSNVKLDFYVWPSDMDLEYELTSAAGEISKGIKISKPKAFNIIFDKTDSMSVGFIFEGTLKPEIPFFTSVGGDISPNPTITIDGQNIILSESCTTVLRADGKADGYRHTLTIPIAGNVTSINSPTVTVTWGSCASDDVECIEDHMDVMEMDIPQCVNDLLGRCESEDNSSRDSLETLYDEDPKYMVYWNTCNGKPIKEFWKEPDE